MTTPHYAPGFYLFFHTFWPLMIAAAFGAIAVWLVRRYGG